VLHGTFDGEPKPVSLLKAVVTPRQVLQPETRYVIGVRSEVGLPNRDHATSIPPDGRSQAAATAS
jgi:hypothetical protein